MKRKPLQKFCFKSILQTMNSSNTTGRTRITLQFSLERDIDSRAQDVQTPISQATRRLPDHVDPVACGVDLDRAVAGMEALAARIAAVPARVPPYPEMLARMRTLPLRSR